MVMRLLAECRRTPGKRRSTLRNRCSTSHHEAVPQPLASDAPGRSFQHNQVGRSLVEVPPPAAAAHIRLDARLEKRIQHLALLGLDVGDPRKSGWPKYAGGR